MTSQILVEVPYGTAARKRLKIYSKQRTGRWEQDAGRRTHFSAEIALDGCVSVRIEDP